MLVNHKNDRVLQKCTPIFSSTLYARESVMNISCSFEVFHKTIYKSLNGINGSADLPMWREDIDIIFATIKYFLREREEMCRKEMVKFGKL